MNVMMSFVLRKDILTYFAILFLFYVANAYTPLWADDYCRMSSSGFLDPLSLAWRDYFQWTGRFVPTAITYFVMQLYGAGYGFIFDFFNALTFVSLIYNVIGLVQFYANSRSSYRLFGAKAPELIVLVGLMLWWLPRSIAEVSLWKTGSIGYLWPVAGEVWLLRVATLDRKITFWQILFAFVIADFLEPLSALCSLLLLMLSFSGSIKNRKSVIAVAVAHVAGTICLLLAPGNFVRAATMAPSPPSDRMIGVFGNLGSLFDPIWVLAVAIIAITFVKGSLESSSGNPVPSSGVQNAGMPSVKHQYIEFMKAGRGWRFFALSLLYMALLLAVPRSALAARVSFPASVLLICYLAAVFSQSSPTPSRVRLVRHSLSVAVVATLLVVIPDLNRLASIDAQWSNDPQLKMGPEENAVLQKFLINGKSVYARKDIFFEGVTSDPGYFINTCYAAAKHVKSVVIQ